MTKFCWYKVSHFVHGHLQVANAKDREILLNEIHKLKVCKFVLCNNKSIIRERECRTCSTSLRQVLDLEAAVVYIRT